MQKENCKCEEVNIVYASDDKFAEILAVSLVSLYDNNKNISNINVFVFDSNISDENKVKLETISKSYGRTNIIWLKAINISEKLNINVSLDRGSLSQYARLFVDSVLPQNIQRVLYLDCDIIINKSIIELWNLNLHGKTIAALNDAFSKWYRRNINLDVNDVMFNSGVMLIDMDRWRTQKIEERLLSFISKKKGYIQQGDQGALNNVLSKDVYCFEPKFNSVTIFYDFSYKELLSYRKPAGNYYTEEDLCNAVNDAVIIHYTTSMFSLRPWFAGCKHQYAYKWDEYKSISPYNDNEPWELSESTFISICKKIYYLLPRKISISIAGLFQAYFRPWKNYIVLKLRGNL